MGLGSHQPKSDGVPRVDSFQFRQRRSIVDEVLAGLVTLRRKLSYHELDKDLRSNDDDVLRCWRNGW